MGTDVWCNSWRFRCGLHPLRNRQHTVKVVTEAAKDRSWRVRRPEHGTMDPRCENVADGYGWLSYKEEVLKL